MLENVRLHASHLPLLFLQEGSINFTLSAPPSPSAALLQFQNTSEDDTDEGVKKSRKRPRVISDDEDIVRLIRVYCLHHRLQIHLTKN